MEFAPKVTFIGIDPYKGKENRKFPFIIGRAENLPFKNNLFNGVLFATSLNHLKNPQRGIDQAYRVLKKSGFLFIWNGLNVVPQISHFEETSVLANISSSDEYKTATFQLPPKPIHEGTAGSYQHFVVTVRSYSDIGDESYTFMPFYLQELNEFYGRNLYFQWDRTRVEPDGLGIIIESYTDSLNLNAVKVKKLVENLFSVFGMKIRPSQAGLKTEEFDF